MVKEYFHSTAPPRRTACLVGHNKVLSGFDVNESASEIVSEMETFNIKEKGRQVVKDKGNKAKEKLK